MLHILHLYIRACTTGDCQVCFLQLLSQLHDPLIPATELLIPLSQLARQIITLILQAGLLHLQCLLG